MSERAAGKLVMRSPGGQRAEFPLTEQVTTLGRGTDCDLALDDDFASRHHARVEIREDEYVIVDDNSRNGVTVNGKPIRGSHVLSSNDEIVIGETIIRFETRPSEENTTKELPPRSTRQLSSPVQVDAESWEVWIEGNKLSKRLSVLEFRLLAALFQNADAVCSRDELCGELWGKDAYTYDMLHQLVHRLKRRIEPDPANARYIIAIPRVGYRLKVTPD